MLLPYGKLAFIDLETTGPAPATDRITEIGIVEVTAAGVRRWSALVNPQLPIPPFIQNLTGITDDMVRTAPTFALLKEEVLQRLADGLFIAHNARFDYGFLRHEFQRHGLLLRRDVLCTVKLSRKLFPQEARHSLDALIERHNLVAGARHRALADAELLWQFWQRLQASVPQALLRDTVRQLVQRPELPAHLDLDQLEDLPDAPGVYVFYGERDLPLFVGKAAHLRQRVLTHFHAERPSARDRQLARETRRLQWHPTAGDTGAQLLEAQLRRSLPDQANDARRREDVCAWQLRATAAGELCPVLVHARECDFSRADSLHGLFTTPEKARGALRALATRHGLCLMLLGLETMKPGQPCTAFAAHACRGACVGAEAPTSHRERLRQALAALQLVAWPYPSAAALAETSPDGRQGPHVIHPRQ